MKTTKTLLTIHNITHNSFHDSSEAHFDANGIIMELDKLSEKDLNALAKALTYELDLVELFESMLQQEPKYVQQALANLGYFNTEKVKAIIDGAEPVSAFMIVKGNRLSSVFTYEDPADIGDYEMEGLLTEEDAVLVQVLDTNKSFNQWGGKALDKYNNIVQSLKKEADKKAKAIKIAEEAKKIRDIEHAKRILEEAKREGTI